MTTETKPETSPGRYTPLQIACFHATGLVLKTFFTLWGGYEVIGLRENIPATGPILLCANHASNVDPPLGWAAFYGYRRLRGVAKIELWKPRAAAYILDAHESIPVARGAADRSMFRNVFEGLKRGDAIGVFPEGTRTWDGKLNPAQPGIGVLVLKSGVPVAPIAVLGTFNMLPRGTKFPKRTKLKIVFGKPISFSPDTPREEIASRIMVEIAALMTAHGVPTEPPDAERARLAAERSATDD